MKSWPETARVPAALLIANRGEIAVRIIRACRELGIRSIAVYSDADAGALHVRLADQACRLGPAAVRESYLHSERLLEAARARGAAAVHPGYGLLSENAAFAAAVIEAGLTFVGPTPAVIARMGDKVAARAAAAESGVPLLPASARHVVDIAEAKRAAGQIGYPLVIKASHGGGGRGMRVVHDEARLEPALREAARESNAAFGRGEVYLEKYICRARHVEVQILADAHGNIVHIGDRDCSVQRRHQKLIEEAPAPELPRALRAGLRESAVRLAQAVGYLGAGTVEFLVDPAAQTYYFLEMNTRLQVEHGVSELVSGVDLVQSQLHIACGEALPFTQADIQLRGAAIQARIAAEDPWSDFQPSAGKVSRLQLPTAPWVRCDFGVEAGDVVSAHYDSLVGKVQAWGPTRETARRRLIAALAGLEAVGVATTAPYLRQVLEHGDFASVKHDTGSIERVWRPDPQLRPLGEANFNSGGVEDGPRAAAPRTRRVRLSTSQGVIEVDVHGAQRARTTENVQRTTREATGERPRAADRTGRSNGEPLAPIDGAVIQVAVKVGDVVKTGDLLAVMEAMKMELPVRAARAGTVEAVLVEAGQVAAKGSLLVALAAAPASPGPDAASAKEAHVLP
ncbi:MAG TPA: biotin carboxylase N-terminal domain-containing protein [Steroidobacteraceae bacterium]|nr:biotin carboxylase N-terminal domain-containing protein [Steroidobacteraceae bacterium]